MTRCVGDDGLDSEPITRITVPVARGLGPWLPSVKRLTIPLPSTCRAGPLRLEASVPLEAITWKTRWPQPWRPRPELAARLRKLLSRRSPSPDDALLALVVLHCLAPDAAAAAEARRDIRARVAAARPVVALDAYRTVDPKLPQTLAFEFRRDVVHKLRSLTRGSVSIADMAELKRIGTRVPESPQYTAFLDLVAVEVDRRESVAATTGEVKVGTRRRSSPAYVNLVNAQTAARDVPGRIADGRIGAGVAADRAESQAVLRGLGAALNGRSPGQAAAGGALLGMLGDLMEAGSQRTAAARYQALVNQAGAALNRIEAQLAKTPKTLEEPVLRPFRKEQAYVVKEVRAAAYMQVRNPQGGGEVPPLLSDKLAAGVVEADSWCEGNKALGQRADPLELPTDRQMQRKAVHVLVDRVARYVFDRLLSKIGFEDYALAKMRERTGDRHGVARHLVRFPGSPAARFHSVEAEDARLILEHLVADMTGADTCHLRGVIFDEVAP